MLLMALEFKLMLCLNMKWGRYHMHKLMRARNILEWMIYFTHNYNNDMLTISIVVQFFVLSLEFVQNLF